MPGPQAEPRPAATSASVPPDCSDGEAGGDVVSLQRAKAPGPCSGRSSPVISEEPVGPSPAPPWAARGQPLTPSLSEWCHPLPALPQPPPLSTPCQEWWDVSMCVWPGHRVNTPRDHSREWVRGQPLLQGTQGPDRGESGVPRSRPPPGMRGRAGTLLWRWTGRCSPRRGTALWGEKGRKSHKVATTVPGPGSGGSPQGLCSPPPASWENWDHK